MDKKLDLTVDWSMTAETGIHAIETHWNSSALSTAEKLSSFPKYCERTSLSRFIVKNHIFQLISGIQGSIVECGVHFGGGLFTWANLSSIYEPLNHRRRIVGFDTFQGFPEIAPSDLAGGSDQAVQGGYSGGSLSDLEQSIRFYNLNRPFAQIPKVELVSGDFVKTWEKYVSANPHLIVSLLYLDFDIYLPTKFALEQVVSRMPKGAVIAFDELHCEEWPGETLALIETLGINALKIERLPFSSICWAVL